MKNDIFQRNNLSKNDFFQRNNFFFLRGERIEIFYTCEVFEVFEVGEHKV